MFVNNLWISVANPGDGFQDSLKYLKQIKKTVRNPSGSEKHHHFFMLSTFDPFGVEKRTS